MMGRLSFFTSLFAVVGILIYNIPAIALGSMRWLIFWGSLGIVIAS
jgi:hypothetical protein